MDQRGTLRHFGPGRQRCRASVVLFFLSHKLKEETMPKFRKRPVVIEAYQTDRKMTCKENQQADPGDWIITGVGGEQYPCRPDIFEAAYEEIHADEAKTGPDPS